MFSIHTSVFNVQRAGFDWRGAFTNWLAFLGSGDQLVIAVNTSEDDSPRLIREWLTRWQLENASQSTQIDVLDIAIPYSDPEFDGKGKAAALAACTRPFCILLDLDERIIPSMRLRWMELARELERSPYEAFLVPSLDLIGDEQHYRANDSIGAKWYLHRNLPYLTRGVFKGARREDGSIDKTKSDTCELIRKETCELVQAGHIVQPGFPHWMTLAALESGIVPFVYHLGSLNLEQRVKQSAFWRPVWDNRDKQSQEPELTLAELEKVPRYRHRLGTWKERT